MGFTFEEFPNADYYRSDLRKILKYVRSIESYIKTWDEVVAELRETIKNIDQYGQDISALQTLTNKLDSDVTKLKSDVTFILKNLTEINDWRELTDGKLRAIALRIDQLKIYVDDMDNVLMADYNNKFTLYSLKMNQMKDMLMSYINGIIERMAYIIEHLSSDVYDPIRAKRITFDKNNEHIYADLRYGGITEEGFAELGLTEEELQSIGLTQYEWAFHSMYFFKDFYIYSPVRGIRMSPYQALSDVLTFVCSTMTEEQFEALNLTEEEFEALNLTHREYLTYNSTDNDLVVVKSDGLGLTENQLQHLDVL